MTKINKKNIGIVALAGVLQKETLLAGANYLTSLGFNVKIAPSCFDESRIFNPENDEARARELINFFKDDDIEIILNMRGGYGSNRIFKYIKDFEFIKYPKIFIGYSDITYIHILLNQKHGLKTYHGPMITDLLTKNKKSINSFLEIAINNNPLTLKGIHFLNPYNCLIEGTVVGGNLSIICSTLATDNEIDTRGKILFIEDVNEDAYKIDRMLMQLKYSNKLEGCIGIIIGDFSGSNEKDIYDTILKMLLPLNVVVATGILAGHSSPNLTIPLGGHCVMDCLRQELRFE